MASLWIRSGLGWPERDFEVVIQTYQVGAHFEALDELVFMAPSDLRCIFFITRTLPFELCEEGRGGQAIVLRLCNVRRGEGGLNCLCTQYVLNGWPLI